MTDYTPQTLSLYFDAASAQKTGLPDVYRNVDGYAVLATHTGFQKDTSIPPFARFTGRANFGVGNEADHVLAHAGNLTTAGASYCRVHGIEQTHAALVAYTINTAQQQIYRGFTPAQRIRELAKA